MVQPIGSYGLPNDFFWPAPFNETAFIQGCVEQFGTTPRPNWVAVQYGATDLSGLSNVVFTNGNLDPWFSGGITTNSTGDTHDVVAFVIEGAAHHLDLRAANPADPPGVLQARAIQEQAIVRWCNAYTERAGVATRLAV